MVKGEPVETVEKAQNPHEIKPKEAGTTPTASDTHMHSEMEGVDMVVAEYEAAVDDDLVQFVKNVRERIYEHPSAESYSIGQASLRAGQDVYDLTKVAHATYRFGV